MIEVYAKQADGTDSIEQMRERLGLGWVLTVEASDPPYVLEWATTCAQEGRCERKPLSNYPGAPETIVAIFVPVTAQ